EGDAHEAQGRLGVLRQPQLIVVRADQQVTEVDVRGARAAIAQVRDFGISQELRAHAGVLRALAWKEKGDSSHLLFGFDYLAAGVVPAVAADRVRPGELLAVRTR